MTEPAMGTVTVNGGSRPTVSSRMDQASEELRHARFANAVLMLSVCGYICARLLEIFPRRLPRTGIVALDVVSAMTFALMHGARSYGWRTMTAFVGICLVIGNVIENIGVVTGFPFGHYYFVELMGPKVLNVPVLLGLAYIGMAYVAWTLARLIVGDTNRQLLAVPVTAAFIMVAWDLAQDPVWATVLHGWVWRDGGPWFGVPVSNYFGWYLTVFLIYTCFAIFLRRRMRSLHERIWRPQAAVLFYALCAAGNVMQTLARPEAEIVYDPTEKAWRAADIIDASALVSIFVMGAFAAMAWVSVNHQKNDFTRPMG